MSTPEKRWIQHIADVWPQSDLRHDAYVNPQTRQVITTDMLVEGVHFKREWMSLYDIGWKAVAVNLSDLAASGAKAQQILCSLGVPAALTQKDMEDLMSGITACCQQYHAVLVGGDTVNASQLTINITALGQLSPKAVPGRRHTAQPGDVLCVSGLHGLSHVGLLALQNSWTQYSECIQAHTKPMAQLILGQRLAEVLPHYAMMDSSDGLADACLCIAEASQVDVILDVTKLTAHAEVVDMANRLKAEPLQWILYGGEDYQLVVSMPPELLGLFPQLTAIGRVVNPATPGHGQAFCRRAEALEPLKWEQTFDHFSQPYAVETSRVTRKSVRS